MFSQCCKWTFFGLISVYLGLHGAAGFFVKHVNTGKCIFATDKLLVANIYFLELSNNCLDPAAQFQFRDINGAMLNLKRQGCLDLIYKTTAGTSVNTFFVHAHPGLPLDAGNGCRDVTSDENYRGITQTSGGALFVRQKGHLKPAVENWCAVPVSDGALAAKQIDTYIGGTTPCDDAPNKRFHFGSVTCHGNTTENVNCPKDQYMVVKTASYRGLLDTKTCGSSDNYTCQVDVTCLVRKNCDGQHECNITVDGNLFPGDLCQGMKRYLYFEYQCINTSLPHDRCALLPDKPRHLVVTKIKSRSAQISWINPENEGAKPVNQFRIKLTKDGALIQNNTIGKVYKQEINNLTPFTTYKVSVAAGNAHGFGEENVTTFTTSEDAAEGPPLNIKVTAESSSSLLVEWEPPEKDKQNGRIVSYTVCLSYSDSEHCSENYTTKEQQLNIINLKASTKYYVRVLASTNVGPGNYSQSEVKITNGIRPEMAKNETNTTLTFPLQIPSLNYTHFYVVAFKRSNGKPNSPDSYSNKDLVTYAEAKKPNNQLPYIAAVVPSSEMDEHLQFVLGDGRSTSDPTTRRRRSTTNDYYNGPLEPGASYSIFQRVFINENEFYSTEWSPASQTSPAPTLGPTPRPGGPRVLSNMTSGDIKAKEGDLVNLLCTAQGEPPITFTWEKDHKTMSSFSETLKPHRSSFLVLTVKDQTSFGKYICRIQDRFESTTHTMWILEDTGSENNSDSSGKYLVGIIVLAILLVISLVILAYLIYFVHKNGLRSSSTKRNLDYKSSDRNVSRDICENPDKDGANKDYEQVEDEQSTYTALKRTGKEEQNAHLYTHLNEVVKDYENLQETGM